MRADQLAAQPLLSGLPEETLRRLSGHARLVRFGPGQRLFREGQPATEFWLLTEGLVALDMHVPGAGDLVIQTLSPGEVLGWSWMFPPRRWHLGAVTRQQVAAYAFPAEAVLSLCDEDPVFGYQLTRRLAAVMVERLQATRVRLLDLYGRGPTHRQTPGVAHVWPDHV